MQNVKNFDQNVTRINYDMLYLLYTANGKTVIPKTQNTYVRRTERRRFDCL